MTPGADLLAFVTYKKYLCWSLLKVFVSFCVFRIEELQDRLPQSLACFLSIFVANYKGEKVYHRITALLKSCFQNRNLPCCVELRSSPFQCSKIYLGLV